MVDGLVEVAVFGEPGRRGAVELCDPVGMVALESTAQEFREHLVVPKPLGIAVDPLQEQAAPLDLLEHRLPAGSLRSADASPPQIRSVIELASRNSAISGSSVSKTFSARNSPITSLAPGHLG